MARRRKRDKLPAPRFPREKWLPGQAPRIEKPKKGRGSYHRQTEADRVRKDVDEQQT
jgi:hypothetical protein